MPLGFVDPYSGAAGSTCSVSFDSIASNASVHDNQTEAEFHKAKFLGEWGVVKAKHAKGEIPSGTKVLSFDGPSTSGYVFVSNGKLMLRRTMKSTGATKEVEFDEAVQKTYFVSASLKWSIPQQVSGKKDLSPIEKLTGLAPGTSIAPNDLKLWSNINTHKGDLPNGTVVAELKADGARIVYKDGMFALQLEEVVGWDEVGQWSHPGDLLDEYSYHGWSTPDGTEHAVAPTVTPNPIAAPTPKPPVNIASPSTGSMTDEDVATMFVKIKDKLAADQGVNVKGSNPALDQKVYQAIGDQTGYTPAEVKGKIDAYKASGKKLSALKKKVLKKDGDPAPEPDATPTNPTPVAAPHGVPTEPDTGTVDAAVASVGVDKADYSDEDVAAAYIMAKDKVVAESNGKWTLYSKNDEMDKLIYDLVQQKTGHNANEAKHAIAAYLSEPGKKLSTLKKSLIKSGKMKAEADTLKKKNDGSTTTSADIDGAAASGYSPPPAPATPATPTTPAVPAWVGAYGGTDPGDITHLSDDDKNKVELAFGFAYLSDSPETVFTKLHNAIEKLQPGELGKLTPLQVVRVIDERKAKLAGVPNGNLYEKKISTWLTSPSGRKWFEDQAKKEEAKAKAQAFIDSMPPLPPDSALFTNIEEDEARDWQSRQTPWTSEQERNLKHYTSNQGYTEMNGNLRGQGYGGVVTTRVREARKGMRPLERPVILHRGTTAISFGLADNGSENELLYGLVGTLHKQVGFSSASFGARAGFGSKPVIIHFEAPAGCPGAFIRDISFYKDTAENELLLDHNIQIRVLRVEKIGSQYHVQVRIEGWEGNPASA